MNVTAIKTNDIVKVKSVETWKQLKKIGAAIRLDFSEGRIWANTLIGISKIVITFRKSSQKRKIK